MSTRGEACAWQPCRGPECLGVETNLKQCHCSCRLWDPRNLKRKNKVHTLGTSGQIHQPHLRTLRSTRESLKRRNTQKNSARCWLEEHQKVNLLRKIRGQRRKSFRGNIIFYQPTVLGSGWAGTHDSWRTQQECPSPFFIVCVKNLRPASWQPRQRSTDRNPSLSTDTTILNLLSWLCPTSFLTVVVKLSLSVNTCPGLFKLFVSTSVREPRAMCNSDERCLNN